MNQVWLQNYDPLHHAVFSTAVAACPVIVLLGSIAVLRIKVHLSAMIGLAVALVVALWAYRMPLTAAAAATLFGAGFGLFPIGWIILNVIFLYQLTVKRGLFEILRNSLAALAPDPRVQVILIAFSFGAFIEGVAGFGAPVAITGAILTQLGFRPLHAAVLALIANTAPVAFGSLGIPITTMEQVTGLDALKVSAMVGRQLPFFSLLIPFWVVGAFAGWRGLLGVWPAALVAGVAFALPQFLISNFHGPWLVDTISGACSISALILLLRFWRPHPMRAPANDDQSSSQPSPGPHLQSGDTGIGNATVKSHPTAPLSRASKGQVLRSWSPWAILTICILLWGLPQTKVRLDSLAAWKLPVSHLHNLVQRVPPVAPVGAKPEAAEFRLNLLSATGTGILLAAVIAGLSMGFGLRELAITYAETIWRIRFSLLTIAAMLAIGNVTKYSGTDATLGLALAQTGWLYPFFGTLLGWLGVALTGSDTASNVLFGSLQKITSEKAGLSPFLMAAANSSGGVMGKMIDAQSIVVASTATNWYGHEGSILRRVFLHSLALAAMMGLLVLLQAYWPPLSRWVIH
jgi:lactate permease